MCGTSVGATGRVMAMGVGDGDGGCAMERVFAGEDMLWGGTANDDGM